MKSIGNVGKEDLAEHINRLFDYDANGLRENYLLVYSLLHGFESCWQKYKQAIKDVRYKYNFLSFIELENSYLGIKVGRAKHDREGQIVYINHVVVDMKDR